MSRFFSQNQNLTGPYSARTYRCPDAGGPLGPCWALLPWLRYWRWADSTRRTLHGHTRARPAGDKSRWAALAPGCPIYSSTCLVVRLGYWAILPLVLILIGWTARRRALREAVEPEVRPLWLTLSGFLVLLVCVSTFAALRFHTSGSALPMGPGGVLGEGLATLMGVSAFGFTGATLIVGSLLLLSWRDL